MSDPNYDEMTDEEISAMDMPAGMESAEVTEPEPEVEAEPAEETQYDTLEDKLNAEASPIQEAQETPPEEPAEEEATAEEDTGSSEEEAPVEEDSSSEEDHTTPHQAESETEEEENSDETAGSDDVDEDSGALNYEDEYKKIMAPFRANGREIELKSPDEVIRLMQMGANYTKKMQTLKPNLKLMRMLENNGLLEESKLSFLIDLDKKNPQAIQQLLHDSNVDPMDLDTASDPAYKPGNHAVSDQEMDFVDVLGDVRSTPEGMQTITMIDSEWDQASQEAVYREPKLLSTINNQRANGIFDTIKTEVDRQVLLGILDSNVPFIAAYKQVGDQLQQEGRLIPKDSDGNPGNKTPTPKIVETRTAAKRKPVANGDRAKAASPASGSTAAPKPSLNPFTMTDEEIMALP